MSDKVGVRKLIGNLECRLQLLKEQQALRGLDTPPHILAEIQDVNAKIEKLQMELGQLDGSQVDEESQSVLSGMVLESISDQKVGIYMQEIFPLSQLTEDGLPSILLQMKSGFRLRQLSVS